MKSDIFKKNGIGRKITLLFVLCMAAVLFIGGILFNGVLMNSVNDMENVYVQNSISKIENAYSQEVNGLQLTALSWGPWDSLFNTNPETISDYQMRTEFKNNGLNMMLFTDTSGNVIYGKMMDMDTEQMSDVSPEILSWLTSMRMLDNNDSNRIIKGIINLNNGPMIIASGTFVPNGLGNMKMAGNIFFGRYFDHLLLDRLSTQLDYKLSMTWLDASAFKNLKGSKDSSGNLIQINPLNNDTIQGNLTVSDISRQAAMQLSVTLPRDIHKMGLNAFYISVLLMIILFSINFMLLLLSISRVVLSRMGKLHQDVERITQDRTFSERVQAGSGKDEISCLSSRINGMLDVMEDLHETVKKQNDELDQTVKLRTEELTEANVALSREKERIKHIAYHDTLTGLPNGTYLNDYLAYQISFSERTESPMAVFFLDLDGFKIINDTLGHAAGDQLLVQVAKRLLTVLRRSDFIARIGGDEFVILIGSIKQQESVEIISKKLLSIISDPFVISEQECFMTASIGIAFCPQDGNTAEELLKNADLALYRAKSDGRNQACYCTEEMKSKIRENMVLSNQLWRALERSEFELYYQPQIVCNTGRIAGMEALIRWNHPERGLVMPTQFISLVEQTGAIIPIGEWVLKQACGQCKKWQDMFGIKLRMSVNVSIKQLQNRDIVAQVLNSLNVSGLNPSSLELEITESILLREVTYALEILNSLKQLGVMISIDDFGTEYASLSYLKHMPVDKIKIAMPFVQGLDENEKDQAITKSLIILAKNMGLSVIAEGVETESQLDFLTNRLCDETQGFYLYRPMPAQEIEKLLASQQEK